jgi:hypothetical protein
MTQILKLDMSTREVIDVGGNSHLDGIGSFNLIFNNHVARAITANPDFARKSREEKIIA